MKRTTYILDVPWGLVGRLGELNSCLKVIDKREKSCASFQETIDHGLSLCDKQVARTRRFRLPLNDQNKGASLQVDESGCEVSVFFKCCILN